MTKLNDMQLILLSTASQREDGHLLPLPDRVTGKVAAANKALASLLKQALACESHTNVREQTWREDGEWRIGLVITEEGLKAIGAELGENRRPVETAPEQPSVATSPAAPQVRGGSKQKAVVELLKRAGGASLQEMVDATGWLPHTTRAALTGLKKKGLRIDRSKVEGETRYCITGEAE